MPLSHDAPRLGEERRSADACHPSVVKRLQGGGVETIQQCRALRAASLQQARALRAAIPRQACARVVELMRGEVERLEAVADDCRRRIDRLLAVVDA